MNISLFSTLLKTEYNNIKYQASTEDIFAIFNKLFFTTYKNVTSFFTSIVVDVFLDLKIIKYSSAGHPRQYAIIDNEVHNLDTTQFMTSVLREEYQPISKIIEYKNNYKLILFTDGLFELENKKSKN